MVIDRLVDKATITSGLHVGKPEVFRSLRHYIRAESQGHQWPWGERCWKRKCSMTFLGRMGKGHGWSDQLWNWFKDNTKETSERRGGAHIGFPLCVDTILNWTELNWTVRAEDIFVIVSCVMTGLNYAGPTWWAMAIPALCQTWASWRRMVMQTNFLRASKWTWLLASMLFAQAESWKASKGVGCLFTDKNQEPYREKTKMVL